MNSRFFFVDFGSSHCLKQYSIGNPFWNPKVDQNIHQSLGLKVSKSRVTESDVVRHKAGKHSCLLRLYEYFFQHCY